jgi:hypothetical protein
MGVGFSHHRGQIARDPLRLVAFEPFDFDLEVLRQQLSNEQRLAHKPDGSHPSAEKWGQAPSAGQDPLGVVARHVACRLVGRLRRDGFLEVHQAMFAIVAF